MTLIFRDDAYLRSCSAIVTAIDERGIRLDRTVFYPTGGGQPGDRAVLSTFQPKKRESRTTLPRARLAIIADGSPSL